MKRRKNQELATAAGLEKQYKPNLSLNKFNLTIGLSPKFIWFRNAKVGTRSTLQILEESGTVFSVKQCYGWHYPIKYYEDYFKFGFVRNPWDRVVSAWKNKIKKRNVLKLEASVFESLQDFENFVDYIATQDITTCNIHYRCQVRLLDVAQLDYTGRFERFEEDLRAIMNALGLSVEAVPWINKSNNRRQYHTYYTSRTRDIIARVYQEDIETFGYRFGDDNA